MIWRLLHIVVLAGLVLAAADVYKIKYESTLEAERVARWAGGRRGGRALTAWRGAEWRRPDGLDRLRGLPQRHLRLKPPEPRQYDPLDKRPEKRVDRVPPGTADPIGA